MELLQEQSRALLVTRGTSALDLRAPVRWSAPRSEAFGELLPAPVEARIEADLQANQQIDALSLKPEEVRRNYTVSGYVFFPKGQYSQVEMLLVDRETGDTQVVREPWH